VPTWVLVALNFYFGLDTRLTVSAAAAAADALLGARRHGGVRCP
jgi:multicomponent Na+:H+ antiporter subunit D